MTRTSDPGMSIATPDLEQLVCEHHALVRHYGRAQVRCSEQLRAQAQEIIRLRAETMRLRAALITRETALAWAREAHIARPQAGIYSSCSMAPRHCPGRRHATDTKETPQ